MARDGSRGAVVPVGSASPPLPTRKIWRSGTGVRPSFGAAARQRSTRGVPGTAPSTPAAAAAAAGTVAGTRRRPSAGSAQRRHRRRQGFVFVILVEQRRAGNERRRGGNASVALHRAARSAASAAATPPAAPGAFAVGRRRSRPGFRRVHASVGDDDGGRLPFASHFGGQRTIFRFLFGRDRRDADRRSPLGLLCGFLGQFAQRLGLFRSRRLDVAFPPATALFLRSRIDGRNHFGKHVIFFVVHVENADPRRVAGDVRGVLDLDQMSVDNGGGRRRVGQAPGEALDLVLVADAHHLRTIFFEGDDAIDARLFRMQHRVDANVDLASDLLGERQHSSSNQNSICAATVGAA